MSGGAPDILQGRSRIHAVHFVAVSHVSSVSRINVLALGRSVPRVTAQTLAVIMRGPSCSATRSRPPTAERRVHAPSSPSRGYRLPVRSSTPGPRPEARLRGQPTHRLRLVTGWEQPARMDFSLSSVAFINQRRCSTFGQVGADSVGCRTTPASPVMPTRATAGVAARGKAAPRAFIAARNGGCRGLSGCSAHLRCTGGASGIKTSQPDCPLYVRSVSCVYLSHSNGPFWPLVVSVSGTWA